MSILSPILITLLVGVIYAWAFQSWPPGWGPLAMFLVIAAMMSGVVAYYMKHYASEEERGEFTLMTALPTLVACGFALVMTGAWWLAPVRAGATRLAGMHSAQPVEQALGDADAMVRKHACLELVRIAAADRSVKLLRSFEAHPEDVPACIEAMQQHELGTGKYMAERITERWARVFRRTRTDAQAEVACMLAPSFGKTQRLSGMATQGSSELFECALSSSNPKARACCAQAFAESTPSGFTSYSPEALFVRGVDPFVFTRMARVTFGASDLDADEREAGQKVGLPGRHNELIMLGCGMLAHPEPSVRESGLSGMNHIAAQLDCARLGEQNAGAMLHLAVEASWGEICEAVEGAPGKRREAMCQAMELSWEARAYEEARALVLLAIQYARLKRPVADIVASKLVRGYGASGGSGQRKKASGEIGEYLAKGGKTGQLSRSRVMRAAGAGPDRPHCVEFNVGSREDRRVQRQDGVGCSRDGDTIDEIMARRKHILRAVQGKETLQLGDRSKLEKKYGAGALKGAKDGMREVYNPAAERKGMKPMK